MGSRNPAVMGKHRLERAGLFDVPGQEVGDKIPGIGPPSIINIGLSFKRSIPVYDSIGIVQGSHTETFHPDNEGKGIRAVNSERVIFQGIEFDLVARLLKIQACPKKER